LIIAETRAVVFVVETRVVDFGEAFANPIEPTVSAAVVIAIATIVFFDYIFMWPSFLRSFSVADECH
jgi:hypothetical protein